MGMTLKELLTKGEGTLSAQEAKALASQCRMDVETLYTLLEERGIKVLDNEAEEDASLDVDSILAEVENAEANSDELGLGVDEEEEAEENPADLKAAMDELLDDPVKNYLKQIGQIPLLSAEQEVELSRRIHAGAEAAHILQADRIKYGAPEYIKKNSARFSFEEDENSRSYNDDLDDEGGEIAINRHRNIFTFVTNIQDETHRYANDYRKRAMKKKSYAATLPAIPGVGEKTSAALLAHFKTVAAVKAASISDLEEVKGISHAKAEMLYNALRNGI